MSDRTMNNKSLSIVKSQVVTKGKYVEVEVGKKVIKIIFTMHSLDSMQDYDITLEKALNYLLFADEIIKGHGGRFIAHRKLDRYLARVVYERDMDNITVVTFYISYADRYFKGGMYEDKILR